MKVQGAKVLSQDKQSLVIVANTKTATITVTNNANKKAKKYILTNKAVSTVSAPVVTIGKLIYRGSVQEVSGQFKPDGKMNSYKDKYAKIEVDWTAKTAKNEAALLMLEEQMSPVGYFPLGEDGKFTLTFQEGEKETTSFIPGSYKLKATVGKLENGIFTAERKEKAVTLKIEKPKAASFKMTTSYTILAKDSEFVSLKGKGVYQTVSYDSLLNANVGGLPNSFTRYIEFDEKHERLRLTAKWYDEGGSKVGAEHLTGYVCYTARTYSDYVPGCDVQKCHILDEVKGIAKVTVKPREKSGLKYAVSAKETIAIAESSETKITVAVAKAPVNMKYAIVDSKDADSWETGEVSGTEITLRTKKSLSAKKKYTVKLYVIPENSYYADKLGDNATAEEKYDFISKWGIPVKVTVKAANS